MPRDRGENQSLSEREKFIEQALEAYESPLIGYASTILSDLDLARDVVQETFIRLCQQDFSKVESHLKAWLFTVCRNRALDVLRKKNRSQPLEDWQWRSIPDAGSQPDENADQTERFAQLGSYLARLSENQRDVIILKFQQGLSYQEIHEITGLSSGNIGFLIHSGLKRLREILPPDLHH
ncbi:MAG: sigma-70 family RNA polymerase sigma factor [Akkermansiaceae bacterium]|jgi:RNA polymerase sigma-70 factor (ECF subfamily)|nr:sigma-70 family RNA polymerase sigma factor [Akkermansiaceae bacterium]